MYHSLDRRTIEALLRLQALLGTLNRCARVRRILVDEGADGPRREHARPRDDQTKNSLVGRNPESCRVLLIFTD